MRPIGWAAHGRCARPGPVLALVPNAPDSHARTDREDPMTNLNLVSDAPADLLVTIRDLRDRTDGYLHSACSRRHLLVNVTLIAGALATFLTAAPAFGGRSFATWLTGVFGLSSPAWQLLCAGAAACSLAATIA